MKFTITTINLLLLAGWGNAQMSDAEGHGLASAHDSSTGRILFSDNLAAETPKIEAMEPKLSNDAAGDQAGDSASNHLCKTYPKVCHLLDDDFFSHHDDVTTEHDSRRQMITTSADKSAAETQKIEALKAKFLNDKAGNPDDIDDWICNNWPKLCEPLYDDDDDDSHDDNIAKVHPKKHDSRRQLITTSADKSAAETPKIEALEPKLSHTKGHIGDNDDWFCSHWPRLCDDDDVNDGFSDDRARRYLRKGKATRVKNM